MTGRAVGGGTRGEGVSRTSGGVGEEDPMTSSAIALTPSGPSSLSMVTSEGTVGRIYESFKPEDPDGSGRETASLNGVASDEATEFSELVESLACDFARALRRCLFSERASFCAFLMADLEGLISR